MGEGGGVHCLVRCFSMIVWAPAVLCVSYMYVFLFFFICTCSAQLSMFHMERRSRSMLIIIIARETGALPARWFCWWHILKLKFLPRITAGLPADWPSVWPAKQTDYIDPYVAHMDKKMLPSSSSS